MCPFGYCKGKKATKLDVGKNVDTIDGGALNGAKKVNSVKIRGKLKKVGRGAFKAMKKGTIKNKTSKKTYNKNRTLLDKSGLNPNVTVKRVKK